MKIIYSELSDTGLKRQSNQDRIFSGVSESGNAALFMVADGMGGHYMGDEASGHLRGGIEEWWKGFAEDGCRRSFDKCTEEIKEVIKRSNDHIFRSYTSQGNMCGSTLILLFVYGGRYVMMNVGDSRLYEIRDGKMTQLSLDQTWGAAEVRKGNLTDEEAASDPKYDKLTEGIGCRENYDMQVDFGEIDGASRFLLCSDGLYKFIDETKLVSIVSSQKALPQIVSELKDEVYLRGARDNISVIMADVNGGMSRGVKIVLLCAAAAAFITLVIFLS